MEMITKAKKNNLFIMLSSLTTIMIMMMSSCTLNEGDPQATLCQKLTAHLMVTPEKQVTWNQAVKNSSSDRLQITVSFNNEDSSITQATCTYGLNNRDEGEDYEVDPDTFVNLPDSMVINERAVRTQDLHTAIQKVTGKAVKDTFSEENITNKANAAAETVKEGTIRIKESADVVAEQAKEAATKATEELKKGAEQLKETTNELRHKAGEALEKAGEKLQE